MATRAIWDDAWRLAPGPIGSEFVTAVDAEAASSRCRAILAYLAATGLPLDKLKTVEIGCGSAIYSTIFARLGAAAAGVDQSPEALALSRARASANAVCLSLIEADALEFANTHSGQYDLAMSFGTVEHFRPPMRQAMCRAHVSLVRPGGVVIVSTPNLLFLPHEVLKRLMILRGKWRLGYEGSFTNRELQRTARELALINTAFHGSDAWADARRYGRIVAETRLWKRFLPFLRLGPSPRRGSRQRRPSPDTGPVRSRLNCLLGMDITLIGQKAGT